ncbi:hypothetical protein SGLAM104S_01266 [Streptomyces glaucescens]
MNSTPAPLSTAAAARTIWSGTGEVNTSPGQAAESIPGPTNPPCSGSCPDPPPETSATFPETGASRRTITRFSTSTVSSGCAAAMPRRASDTTVSGTLISIFTGTS